MITARLIIAFLTIAHNAQMNDTMIMAVTASVVHSTISECLTIVPILVAALTALFAGEVFNAPSGVIMHTSPNRATLPFVDGEISEDAGDHLVEMRMAVNFYRRCVANVACKITNIRTCAQR